MFLFRGLSEFAASPKNSSQAAIRVPLRLADLRFASISMAPRRCAPGRSGTMFGFSSRQVLHLSTPFARMSRHSRFAISASNHIAWRDTMSRPRDPTLVTTSIRRVSPRQYWPRTSTNPIPTARIRPRHRAHQVWHLLVHPPLSLPCVDGCGKDTSMAAPIPRRHREVAAPGSQGRAIHRTLVR